MYLLYASKEVLILRINFVIVTCPPQGHIRQRGKILQLSVVYDISPQNKLETC